MKDTLFFELLFDLVIVEINFFVDTFDDDALCWWFVEFFGEFDSLYKRIVLISRFYGYLQLTLLMYTAEFYIFFNILKSVVY